jgi:Flp pilus assembly protein TadD
VETLSSILQYEPANAKALYLRGKCHYVQRNFTHALADFQHARELATKDTLVHTIAQYIEDI